MRWFPVGVKSGPQGVQGVQGIQGIQGVPGTPAAASTVIVAAAPPAGAPAGNQLPIAYDTTLVTGGLYIWNTAAWVKVANIL